ncbi:MAG: FAD-dependent oxidoreductase [Nitrososphaerota archaeon]|nr:FAD-dependent oxidoreductase [Candidatus Bathyarchaeota archaeon]MCX8162464.1 FAD-dependent oxidoreductase [Candidatus Bathyarchaeota archaeon]MDW8062163.1 FAD-dependent oxidoreductase [Nitrososphaerota archaeon]
MLEIWDSVVVGAGPAGLTAGIYLSRLGFKALILDAGRAGGRLRSARLIENYPGFPDGVEGSVLADRFIDHARRFGADIREYEEVTALQLDTSPKLLATRKGSLYQGRTVILAIGAPRMMYSIEGEERLLGRGVSYCAVCDGPLYRGMDVAVVGSGMEALEDATLLSKLARKVYILASKPSRELVEASFQDNVEVYAGAEVKGIIGLEKVESIKFTYMDRDLELPVSAVFLALGILPPSKLLRSTSIELTPDGFIKVDSGQATSIEGVYAAGDCVGIGFQVAVAVGQAAVAALSASRYLEKVGAK